MKRLLQLVADYTSDDLAYAEFVVRVALLAPDSEILLTNVPPRDTLAAGYCVARLALAPGPTGRIVVHDVGMPGPEAVGPQRFCLGRTRGGASVLGANIGFCWSFVAEHVSGPFYLEVPADGPPSRAPSLLATAVVRVVNGHPHAIDGIVPRDAIRPAPSVAAKVERLRSLPVPSHPDGEHSGEQIERNRAQLRTTDTALER